MIEHYPADVLGLPMKEACEVFNELEISSEVHVHADLPGDVITECTFSDVHMRIAQIKAEKRVRDEAESRAWAEMWRETLR